MITIADPSALARAPGRSPCRAATLLLAALLVLVQVVLAAHQVEHLLEPGSEHGCPLCLTGHELDQASPPTAVSIVLPARGYHRPVADNPSDRPRPTSTYQARAPPPSLVAV